MMAAPGCYALFTRRYQPGAAIMDGLGSALGGYTRADMENYVSDDVSDGGAKKRLDILE